ncbi:hypothetical protein N0V93_003667 [Gnomoniopsis smithogilvyi]|uniref:Secreted protein n=1 Tax=Gnomoniopsis smithogilvyi TaxID=1191159 RepID=A0A9W8YYU5_9PEZI|nr:hypothetical protein N0V93_003667 [Gnomoniopsis smithogilvyi]
MLSSLLPTLLLPLVLANPLHTARATSLGAVTQFVYSGSGCTQGSNSVAVSSTSTGYTVQVYTFDEFTTSDTQNCELHFQGSGLSAGWQVSLTEFDAVGSAKGAVSAVWWFWQAYWSDDAADTLTLSGAIENPAGTSLVKANVTEPLWSQCIGASGNPGILNVNFRVVVTGEGSFEVDKEMLKYQFRRCQ